MKVRSALVASLMILALRNTGAAAGTSVLFIGNSFLFGSGSAVRFYRADTVTDLNNEGIGGVPALFKSFAQQAGLDYDVSLETRGGSRAGLSSREQARRDRPARLGHGRDARLQHARRRQAARPGQADRDQQADGGLPARAQSEGRAVPDGDLVARRRDLSRQGRLGRPADRGDGSRRARRVRQGRRPGRSQGGDPGRRSVDARDPDRRRRSESLRRHRRGETQSLDLRQLSRQHARLLPRGAGRSSAA